MKLANQTALITGAGSGLGAAIAKALAAEGARCALAGRRPAPLQSVAAEIESTGGLARVIPADVTDEAQVARLISETMRAFGRLDVLVNSAGVFQMKPFEATTPAFWDQTLNANLRSVFLMCRAAWPRLKQSRGQIVNISSAAGLEGYAGNAAYSASKFGLNGLTEVLAIEGQPHGLRVFAVCPAAADTPIWEGQAPAEVMRRMMKPDAVAQVVCWLVAAPRNLQIGPVVVRNFNDPWINE